MGSLTNVKLRRLQASSKAGQDVFFLYMYLLPQLYTVLPSRTKNAFPVGWAYDNWAEGGPDGLVLIGRSFSVREKKTLLPPSVQRQSAVKVEWDEACQ